MPWKLQLKQTSLQAQISIAQEADPVIFLHESVKQAFSYANNFKLVGPRSESIAMLPVYKLRKLTRNNCTANYKVVLLEAWRDFDE